MKKIIIITFLLLIIFAIFLKQNIVNIVYYIDWDIKNMPNPQKINTVFEFVGAGDIKAFDIMMYNKKSFKKLKEMDIFKIFEGNAKEEVKEILDNYFEKYLNYEEEKIYKSYFNLDNLSTKENYYAILHRYSNIRGHIYKILVLDSKEQLMYSMHCNYGDKDRALD